jgi:hypothetical protein
MRIHVVCATPCPRPCWPCRVDVRFRSRQRASVRRRFIVACHASFIGFASTTAAVNSPAVY